MHSFHSYILSIHPFFPFVHSVQSCIYQYYIHAFIPSMHSFHLCIHSIHAFLPRVHSLQLFIHYNCWNIHHIHSIHKTWPTTHSRVIQREDYKNRKKRLAPLPTAYDKTSTGSYGVSFCSLSQYNLRHRGDFLISLTFLRNSTPNIGGGHPLKKPKNPLFGVNISWTEAKFKIRLGGVNCIEITY